MAALYLFLTLLIAIVPCGTTPSFATYPGLQLPTNLFNHISISFNGYIYIIGGISDNNISSSHIYKSQSRIDSTANNFTTVTTIDITDNSLSDLVIHITEIICKNKCYTVIDNVLYIFIDYESIQILLKYDLESESFIHLNTYNFVHNSSQFQHGCVVSDNNGIIYSFGTNWFKATDNTRIGFKYKTKTDEWSLLYANTHINDYEQHSMGCNMDYYNENIYLFGGVTPSNNRNDNHIQKYNILSETLNTLETQLSHPQSSSTVIQTYNNYFMIFGDSDIEYFDANSEQMLVFDSGTIDNLLFDVSNLRLDIRNFASFKSQTFESEGVLYDILFINGGINNRDFQFINTFDIFDITIDQNPNKMGMICSTVYTPDWVSDNSGKDQYFIDEYIWSNSDQILFKSVSTNNNNGMIRPSISIESIDTIDNVMHTLEYNFTVSTNALHLRTSYLRYGGGPLRYAKKTLYNVAYDSLLWSSWHTSEGCAYFKGGVGSVIGKFASNYRNDYCFDPSQVISAYFYDYNEIANTEWQFYHNLCSLNLDLYINSVSNNRVFSIGDYININHTLLKANRINIPIYIASNDVLNINHSLYINDTNQCIICDSNHICSECVNGIQITDLATFDISQNTYEITIFTDNNHSHNVMSDTVFVFNRRVQTLYVTMPETDNIFVGSYLNFSVQIMDNAMYQTESTIHFHSQSLGINTTMLIIYDSSLAITKCILFNHNMNEQKDTCDQGIGPINPTETIDFGYIYLDSMDTYLRDNEFIINIIKADLQLLFVDKNRNEIVFENTPFYPGFELNILIGYVNGAHLPDTAEIYIEWEAGFNMGNEDNVQIMHIRFETGECFVNLTETITVPCNTNPLITIPWNMTYKAINDNNYSFNVSTNAYDINLLTNAPFNNVWQREIQNISVHSNNNTAVDTVVGAFINVSIDVFSKIYQPYSIIHMRNELLEIKHDMYILYDIHNATDKVILYCVIVDFNTFPYHNNTCDKGLGPIRPENNNDYFEIELYSNHTYLRYDSIAINIVRVSVDVLFHNSSDKPIAFNAIHPNLEIYVIVNVTTPIPLGTVIIIEWDEALEIGNDETNILVNGHNDCLISVSPNTAFDCHKPIIIPENMTYKAIGDYNQYSFNVYSNDVFLVRDYPQYFNRKVQTVSIEFVRSNVSIYEFIGIKINVSDPVIYQPDSEISIYSEIFGIYATIIIAYNFDDIDDTECYINHTEIEPCEFGFVLLEPIREITDADNNVMFELDSMDTYLESDIISIEVVRMQINVTFYDSNGTNRHVINFNETYPGMQIFLHITYDKTSRIQPVGHIYIDWDYGLYLTDHLMHINFDHSQCYIYFEGNDNRTDEFEYSEEHGQCDQPITIPINMTYNAKIDNYYEFNMYSFDTEIISETPNFIQRKLQTIEVIFADSVALGFYISVDINIIDDMILQPWSVVRVKSDELSIDASIIVEYVMPSTPISDDYYYYYNDFSNLYYEYEEYEYDYYDYYHQYNAYILSCYVHNHNTDQNETCSKGIGPILTHSSNPKLKDTINLSSPDTILSNEQTVLPVIEGESVEYNHWITQTDSNNIISMICPKDNCCQNMHGCIYFPVNVPTNSRRLLQEINGYTSDDLCANNRNHSVPLCGACDDEYAFIFNSADCKKCDTDHWEYLLFPLLIAFIVVLIITLFDPNIISEEHRERHKALMREDETEGIQIVMFRICILFYQSINYILWQTGYKFWGTIMIQILSLDSYLWFWILHFPALDGLCFLQNLNGMQYYGWYLYFPACLIFALIMYKSVKKILCVCCCKMFHFGSYTVWNVALIAMFPVLAVFCIMLSCLHIGGEYGSVHFYSADIQCYGIPFLAVTVLLAMFIFFMLCCWIFLKMKTKSARKNNDYFLFGMIRPYKPEYWFWEFVLIMRRVFIIVFITLQYFHNIAMHISLLAILFVFGLIELKCDPFKYRRALYMDLLCVIGVLICLITMIINLENDFFINDYDNEYGETNESITPNQSITMICISIIIFCPIVLLIWFIIDALCSCHSIKSMENFANTNNHARMHRKMQSMEQRLQWNGVANLKVNLTENIVDGNLANPYDNNMIVKADTDTDTDIKEEETDTDSVESDPELTESENNHTMRKNRDASLNALIEAETEDSKTYKSNTTTALSFLNLKRNKSKTKFGYQELGQSQMLSNSQTNDDYNDFDESNTYSNTEMTSLKPPNTSEDKSANKKPFVRKTKLQKANSSVLAAISENPDSNSSKQEHNTKGDEVEISNTKTGTVASSHLYHPSGLVDIRKTKINYITADQNEKLFGVTPDYVGSYNYTQTTNDGSVYSTTDEFEDMHEVTATDMTPINSSDRTVDPNQLLQRMEMISHGMTDTMQNIMRHSSDSDTTDSDNTYDSKLHKHTNEKGSSVSTSQSQMPLNPLNNNTQSVTKLSYSSEIGSVTPFTGNMSEFGIKNFNRKVHKKRVRFADSFNESDSEEKESTLDDLLNDVLSEESKNNSIISESFDEDYCEQKSSKLQPKMRTSNILLSPESTRSTEELHSKNISLNTIEEEQEKGRANLDIDDESEPTSPPALLSKQTSTMSFMSDTPQIILPKQKSHMYKNQNQSEIDNETNNSYKYEYVHHEQDNIGQTNHLQVHNPRMSPSFGSSVTYSDFSTHYLHKATSVNSAQKANNKVFERQRIRGSGKLEVIENKEISVNVGQSVTIEESESETYSSSSVDSELERKSWSEYKNDLSRVFYRFAGYQQWSKKKGVYMSKSEVKRFLEIVGITDYWKVNDVFKRMDSDISDERITINEFIEYFCDAEINSKASDIKKHIQKQLSWVLLLKAVNIFDKLDTDNNGQLEYNEFKPFASILNCDEAEAEALWHAIDTDKSGQIDIVELFEWFKKRLEMTKQSKKKKKSEPREFSGSHSSFDDESTDTRSIMTKEINTNENTNDS